ncbi:MAG TPA: TetR/AcrR family transcriptional regulator [Jatrophihabitans sp.]|nr:TetR/AcrR family transcriptional regulator [Jatrophihabitans sp.]
MPAANSSNRPYHHGRLRDALVEAGLELAREAGPEAVGLRAATRAAGASHNAAYRHFADHDELLRAVCERCMSQLALLMERRMAELPESDPPTAAWARLNALGAAYVEFAVTEPGWFRTAFAVPRGTHSIAPGEGVGASGLGPYELLSARLDELVEVGAIPAARRPGLEYAAWSGVHGLATLLNDGPLRDLPAAEHQHALQTVLDVIARGL